MAASIPALHTPYDDAGQQRQKERLEEHHPARRREQVVEFGLDCFRRGSWQSPYGGLDRVGERPAADDRIEAQHQEARHCAERADGPPARRHMGFCSDRGEACRCVRAASPSDRELHEQQRHHHQCQAERVHDHERPAAVHPNLVGELPDAADSDGRARRGEEKPGSAGPPVCDGHRPSRPTHVGSYLAPAGRLRASQARSTSR